MTLRLVLLFAAILGLGVLTVLAVMDVGYFGILEPHFQTWGGAQVFVDLVIACLLAVIWMVYDSRRSGVPAWPFIIVTLVAGSFGPLLYLVVRELRVKQATAVA